MTKLLIIGTAVAAALIAATSAFAYDGTKCKAPGNCWEPKPGFPDKVAGSKYDPKHDPAELAKQGDSRARHGGAQRQAHRELHEDRQVGLRRRRDPE